MNAPAGTADDRARHVRLVNTLLGAWLGLSAVWAVVIVVTDQLAWPLAMWIATTVGPLTVLRQRLDAPASTERNE